MPFKNKEDARSYMREYIARPDVDKKRKAKFSEWRDLNRDHLKARAASRRRDKRAMCMVASVRVRSRRRDIPFNLDQHIEKIQARMDAGVCEITGEAFDFSVGLNPRTPSIDRITPSLGYIYENIRIVCYAMNCALGDWGEAELRRIVEIWLLFPVSGNGSFEG